MILQGDHGRQAEPGRTSRSELGLFFCPAARVGSGIYFVTPTHGLHPRQFANSTFVGFANFYARVVMHLCFFRADEPGRISCSGRGLFYGSVWFAGLFGVTKFRGQFFLLCH